MANRPFVARFGVVVIVVNIVTILLGAFRPCIRVRSGMRAVVADL